MAFFLLAPLAFAASPTPSAGDIETAALAPGLFRFSDETGLPLPLHDADADRYRRIFRLQDEGRWQEADREIAALGNKVLLGHVLAQRYLSEKDFHAKYTELAAWLQRYADHPEAARIYKLAVSRMPKGAPRPRRPVGSVYNAPASSERGGDGSEPRRVLSSLEQRHLAELRRNLRRKIDNDEYAAAEAALMGKDSQALLGPTEYDQFRAEIVSGFYFLNRDREALAVADVAVAHAKRMNPTVEWAGGLAAWRLKDYDRAAEHFARLATADSVEPWMRAGGAFWAARSDLRRGAFDRVNRWFAIGANYPYTFYGILARRLAGLPPAYNWARAAFTREDIEQIVALPAGVRALALVQAGDDRLAEADLRRVNPASPALAHALLAVSQRTDMPTLAIQLAEQATDAQGQRYDAALFPVPSWTPHRGFIIDRALVFALIRQESRFSTRAFSPAGARGLMQLMPGTARFMASGTAYGGKRHQLFEPELNLTLGQNYLAHLMGIEGIGKNLFMVVAAYNGGPGNLARWQRAIGQDDPLVFLESIPNRETRGFVEHVLANYWIYRDELGQATPGLDSLAQGQWPTYKPDGGNLVPAVAKNGGH